MGNAFQTGRLPTQEVLLLDGGIAHTQPHMHLPHMHLKCRSNAFEDGGAGGAAQLSHASQGRGTRNAFGMHFKCIMVHMHSAPYAYCPYALFSYAFEMHFKCIWEEMHMGIFKCIIPICI